jgi:hypothetical protein
VLIGGMTGPQRPDALLAVNSTLVRGEHEAEVRRTFDVKDDRYLADHRLDGLPVVPFAVATELMAEVAAAARPGLEVAELSQIRLLRGISVDEPGARVRVLAKPSDGAGGPAIDVAVMADEESGQQLYRARARMRAGREAPAEPVAEAAPLEDLPPFPMTVDEAYRTLLFHGPLFQRITAIDGMDGRGARAMLQPCPPSRCLRDAGDGRWWLDPVAFDCALQLQVLWARLNWDVTLLPAEIGSVRVLAHLAGDAIRLELRVDPACRAPLCRADHYFFDPDGRLVATLGGVVGTGSKALNRLAGTARADRPRPTQDAPARVRAAT